VISLTCEVEPEQGLSIAVRWYELSCVLSIAYRRWRPELENAC
jgi:hypothetical protein